MRLSFAPIAVPALCLVLAFTASGQTTARASVVKQTAKPAEIIVVGGTPAAARRAGVGPVTPAANVAAGAGTQKVGGNTEMQMLQVQSLQSKRSTQLQTITDVMSSASGSQKHVPRNVGR